MYNIGEIVNGIMNLFCMVTNGNQSYYGDQLKMYINTESL